MMTSDKVFTTSDGFSLKLDTSNNVWTDGDLSFAVGSNGLPVDDTNNSLEGVLRDLTNTETVADMVSKIEDAKAATLPLIAKATIDAVKEKRNTDELLQLIGIIAGQDLSALDLLIAIRNELNK